MLFNTKKDASELPQTLVFLLIGFVAVLLILGSLVWNFNVSPIQQIQHSPNPLAGKDFLELRNQSFKSVVEFLKFIATSFCGVAIICNVYYAAKRAEAMDKTAIAALNNAQAALKTAQAVTDKQTTERFAQALLILGNDKMETRLGAIYTLERIAQDSPPDYWTIMEILAAFIRENAPLQAPLAKARTPKKEQSTQPPTQIRSDIQAALTVLGRRNYQQDPSNQYLDLSNIDIRGAILKNAHLQGANLNNTNLQGVDLSDANLQSANLEAANLQKAKLGVANLQSARLKGANLQAASLFLANLQLANLDDTNLQEVEFTGANLQDTTFNSAQMQGAKIFVVKNLEAMQIEKADGDSTTKLPENIKAPSHWQRAFSSSEASSLEAEAEAEAEAV